MAIKVQPCVSTSASLHRGVFCGHRHAERLQLVLVWGLLKTESCHVRQGLLRLHLQRGCIHGGFFGVGDLSHLGPIFVIDLQAAE